MQNFTAIGRLRRLKETKMWQNRDLGLDPGLNSPEDKVRHQFCPSGDTSWCKFRRLGNMENAPHHLEPVFLDILEPLYTNCLASFELLPRCLPGITQNVLESINSILWQKVPKHTFHGTKRVHIGACSAVIYYNQGATGKFSVLTLMSFPLFHNALEVARGRPATIEMTRREISKGRRMREMEN